MKNTKGGETEQKKAALLQPMEKYTNLYMMVCVTLNIILTNKIGFMQSVYSCMPIMLI